MGSFLSFPISNTALFQKRERTTSKKRWMREGFDAPFPFFGLGDGRCFFFSERTMERLDFFRSGEKEEYFRKRIGKEFEIKSGVGMI